MSILDRYGIKEVADCTFYEIGSDGKPTVPVLYLDTLKVSTIEQTASSSDAKGGKGNATLISWDFGKEITITLEDALFSARSMAIMFGDGRIRTVSGTAYVMRTEQFTPTVACTPSTASTTGGWATTYVANGKTYNKVNQKFFALDGTVALAESADMSANTTYFCSYDVAMSANSVIEVGASTFPGTYYVTGDTYARSETTGKDEYFQFVVPKAKVQSENSITLEAEGDPSVFNMSLKVLRPADGIMIKLVKYDLTGTDASANLNSTLYHATDLKTGA